MLHLYSKNGPPQKTPLPSARNLDDRAQSRLQHLGAEPAIQDGSYGFNAHDASADIDMGAESNSRHDGRRLYVGRGRGDSRTNGRHAPGRGSLGDSSGRTEDGNGSLTSRMHRPEQGLYSDGYSRPSRGTGSR